ncbi:CPBP family intramembrane glutamic endopeptidase [Alloiococcus sp. CFN-8]|uniref:CPBP family intramembrane glutamic endopeptidase n=1 Tax=Alloiococcus sp. CFN-8 TaxID=3416081 RepID=UPI003CEB3303
MTDNREDHQEFIFPEGMEGNELTIEAIAATSRIGYGFIAFGVIWLVAQVLIGNIIFGINADFAGSMWGLFISNYIAMLFIALPVLYIVVKRLEARKLEKSNIKASSFIGAIMIMYTLSIVGSLLGIAVNYLLNMLFGITSSSAAVELISSGEDILVNFLFAGITAPIVEEFIFRKLLIDRTIKYGSKLSLILSGLLFGLIHWNFQQFFYAFLLGMLFAYIYIKTGKLTYSIILHMILNSVSVLISALYPVLIPIENMEATEIFQYLSTGNTEELLQLFLLLILVFSQYIFAFIGLVILIVKRKSLTAFFSDGERYSGSSYSQEIKGASTIFKSFGMILCIIIFLGMFILTMLAG